MTTSPRPTAWHKGPPQRTEAEPIETQDKRSSKSGSAQALPDFFFPLTPADGTPKAGP